MKKVVFEGIDSVCYKVIENSLVQGKDFYSVLDMDSERVRLHKSGKYEILKERQISAEFLNKGKGIVCQGYVLFKDDENNSLLKEFKQKYEKTLLDYKSYMGGEVYENIKEVYKIPLFKGVIKLYEMNIISEEGLKTRIKDYFNLTNFNMESFITKINSQKEMLAQA